MGQWSKIKFQRGFTCISSKIDAVVSHIDTNFFKLDDQNSLNKASV